MTNIGKNTIVNKGLLSQLSLYFCTKFWKNFSGNIYDLGVGMAEIQIFNKLNLTSYGGFM